MDLSLTLVVFVGGNGKRSFERIVHLNDDMLGILKEKA